jgi:hypothetical protein
MRRAQPINRNWSHIQRTHLTFIFSPKELAFAPHPTCSTGNDPPFDFHDLDPRIRASRALARMAAEALVYGYGAANLFMKGRSSKWYFGPT